MALQQSTITYSELEVADVYWDVLLEYWQGDTEGGNIVGDVDRIADAAGRRQWGEMAAECILTREKLTGALAMSVIAPNAEVAVMTDALWQEVDTAMFWCSQGTSLGADNAGISLDIASAMLERIEEELRMIGLNIPSN